MRSAHVLLLMLAAILVAGCGSILGLLGAPRPSAGPTATPFTSLASEVPPTAPPPTVAADGAVSDLSQILDFWWVYDAQAGGPNVLHFNPDGTYRASHGPGVGITRVKGTFRLEDDILTFENGWFECPEEMSGSYALTLRQGGQMLNFRRVEDECAARWQHTFGTWATWKRGKPPVS
jgi:hypothetical protein